MLTKLTLKNYLSFKNNTSLEFNGTDYNVLRDTNVIDGILKGGLFVGANASGKTNIIRGIRFLLDVLFGEKISNYSSHCCVFSESGTFTIDYEFQIENSKINYSLSYLGNQRKFKKEVLTVDGSKVLDRTGKKATSTITENRDYTDIDDNSLLLREIYFNTKFRNNKALRKWFTFLLNSIYIDGYKRWIFSPGKHPVEIKDFLESPKGLEQVNDFFNRFSFDQRIEYANASSGVITTITNKHEKNIYFKREGIGEPVPFQLESLGNQNLLLILPSFFHVINNGGMLIVDEFSSAFHNFLEELLVKYFMENSSRSQVFLVSHSTNLVSNTIFRPDQIFAVTFKGKEGSLVKRFSSERPRESQNLEKMYTSGVFGGVPNYNDSHDKA